MNYNDFLRNIPLILSGSCSLHSIILDNFQVQALIVLRKTIDEFQLKQPEMSNIIMAGDFNLSDIDWETTESLSGQPGMLKEFMDDMFLNNYIKESTRDKNILDLVMSNNVSLILDSQMIENYKFSDHKLIMTALNIAAESESVKRKV